MSFPTRERGLKFHKCKDVPKNHLVVPHEGTWIEIEKKETAAKSKESFPTRERGLKYFDDAAHPGRNRRSPRGNVD